MDKLDDRIPLGGASQTIAGKRRQRRSPERHQWFDPWRTANGDNLKTLVGRTVGSVRHHERHTKARARARRAVDEDYHVRRIEAVVCSLAHAAVLLPPPTGRIAAKLSKSTTRRSRNDSPLLGKCFSPLIWMLHSLDFLDVRTLPVQRGELSSIAPSPWFVDKVHEAGIQLSDFGRDATEEVVLLTLNSREETPWGQERSEKVYREPIDYADTPETQRYRDAIRHLNRFLSDADIDFLDDGQEPRIDPFDRTLRRRFVLRLGQDQRFDQSGRLYGGFWQNLQSARRRHIRINGEPVTALDYGSMFTRLAYAELGATPPAGDLYAIPGLEGYRSGVKAGHELLPVRQWNSAHMAGHVRHRRGRR